MMSKLVTVGCRCLSNGDVDDGLVNGDLCRLVSLIDLYSMDCLCLVDLHQQDSVLPSRKTFLGEAVNVDGYAALVVVSNAVAMMHLACESFLIFVMWLTAIPTYC